MKLKRIVEMNKLKKVITYMYIYIYMYIVIVFDVSFEEMVL